MATAFLMYHELERQGRAPADSGPGYLRYVVEESRFAEQLDWLAANGLRGLSVGEACVRGFDTPDQVVITFDDGCETDLLAAAPLLLERGFRATCYVVSGWVGRPGFLSIANVRELSAVGIEIGSHSATHAFLSDLHAAALRREMVDSRRQLEDMLGIPVVQFSCPGGRWTHRVADAARQAGFDTVATSRIGANDSRSNRYALARCAVMRDTSLRTFEGFSRGAGLAGLQLRDRTFAVAKTLLGNRLYDTLRGALLRA